MKVVNSEAIYETNGDKYVRVEIYSDTVPATMPTPADIPGYDSSFQFFPGESTMYIVTTGEVYMAGEDGNWYKQ